MGTTSMYRVTQVASGVAGSPYYITGYFDIAAGSAQQAADAWRLAIGAPVGTYCAGYVYDAITAVEEVNPANGSTTGIYPVTVAAVTFNDADQPLPAATSLLLQWRTGVYNAGRENRGRTNIARLGELRSTTGVPNTTCITEFQARITALLADVNVQHVVWSRKLGLWDATASGSVWTQWAVMRSRRD